MNENGLANVNRNKLMGTSIQRLLHPDGSSATTDQEMADLFNQTSKGFYRTHKGSTPNFHPNTEFHMANPLIMKSATQRALEDLNPNKWASSFPKPFKL